MFRPSSSVSRPIWGLLVLWIFQMSNVATYKESTGDANRLLYFSHRQSGKDNHHRRITNLGSDARKRVVSKLKTLIKNVRSINRSLKKEIERLQREGEPNHVQIAYGETTERPNLMTTARSMGPTTQPTRAEKLATYTVNNLLQYSLGVSLTPTEFKTSNRQTSTSDNRNSDSAGEKQISETLGQRKQYPTTSTRTSKYERCKFVTDTKCNRSGPCLWCSNTRACVLKDEYSETCLALAKTKDSEKSVDCFSRTSCHSCVKSRHCVWCDSAEKCLSYHPVQELDVDCPSNKWYWRSCPYQPTVFLIMLPILMTICLLILIAICIKYYRSHKKPARLFQHEDHNFAWNVFKKNKSRVAEESEAFLTDKKKSKIQIRDCREKRPDSFTPGDRFRKTGGLSPHVVEEGKRRAASFGPSTTGSPKRDKGYPGF